MKSALELALAHFDLEVSDLTDLSQQARQLSFTDPRWENLFRFFDWLRFGHYQLYSRDNIEFGQRDNFERIAVFSFLSNYLSARLHLFFGLYRTICACWQSC